MSHNMKLSCLGEQLGLYDFQHTDHEGNNRFFTLSGEEITNLKNMEYPVFPNRYQFGIVEPVIGKMVMGMELLWSLKYLVRKTIETTEE